jgi:hypothetical protein
MPTLEWLMNPARSLQKPPGDPCWTHKEVTILSRHCVHPIVVRAATRLKLLEITDWLETPENGARGRFLFPDMPSRSYSTTLVSALEIMVQERTRSGRDDHEMLFECPDTAFLTRMRFG